jgi:site-specific recombinase XerD
MAAGTGLPASSTLRGYTAHVRLYLAPYLGEVLLAELTTAHVQAMIAAIIRHRHVLGTPISAATLTRTRATLRVALNAAVRRGLLTENPASRAELPKARRPKTVVWTPDRIEAWRRTGNALRSRSGPPRRPRRPRSSCTASKATGCMPLIT